MVNLGKPRIDRRDFLAACSALPLGTSGGFSLVLGLTAPLERIARIEITPVRYPMTGDFKFFTGPHGSTGRAAVLVKVVTEDGTHGWGQSVPIAKWSYETLETVTIVLREYYAPALIGHDPLDLEGALQRLDRAVAPGFSTGMPIARAGLDIALHDLAGKLAGKAMHELWGKPKGGPLTLSWTLAPRSLDEVEGLIEAGQKQGYRNFNIKLAPDPEFDVALAKAVRKLVPDGFLWADANGGYPPDVALAIAPRLADAGVDVLEAPIKPNHLRGYQALKKQGALPIYMDEGVVSPVELEEFIALDMLDGVAMKPARCGGLWSARRQIEVLESAGLSWLGSGLTDPDVSLAASLALYGAYGLKRPAALNGQQFLTADLLTEPFQVKNGTLEVPDGPGLGVDVDEEKLDALRIDCGTERTVHPTVGPSTFTFVDDPVRGALTLLDDEIPVFAYRYGDQLPEGIPADRKRSSYLHPIHGLDGEILTDDFPSDHHHHRGLSLMWPRMKVGERELELWHIKGIRQHFGRWITRRTDSDGATLIVHNDWILDTGKKVASEKLRYRAHAATEIGRAIDVEYRITTLDESITLQGQTGKGYGGLNLRFAPRTETKLATDAGPQAKDSDRQHFGWADLTARFAERERHSGVAILVAPTHPDFPPPWTLRHYGDLNAAWPGLEARVLSPGEVLTLRYRLWIHRGDAEEGQVAGAWRAFTGD